ncbi:MAG: macro domain-containing protein [Spirochaetota bacterium]
MVKIEIIKGDITERGTDAIIHTANNILILGSGLGGAIKAKGGSSIIQECIKKSPVNVGDAVLTKGGNLKARHVIHAAVMEYDGPIEGANIGASLLNSLKLANKHHLKSLSIPDMSIGIVRFSPEECAKIIFSTLKRFLDEENSTLELVEIVLWDIETLRIYKQIYSTIYEQEGS